MSSLPSSHILIVDDNPKNLQLTGKLLKDEGFRISLAEDGSVALAILQSMVPDLVLLDVMMPKMNGYDTCRAIKQNKQLEDIPVIFLTAKNQTEDLVEGFTVGGVDYISKPFNREELLARVRTHLELAYSRKKIVEMNRTRDKLYSIIAHDIRSPFATISQLISAINKGYLNLTSDEVKELFALLDKRTNETLTLLNDLLEWTKFHSTSISINPQPVDVGNIFAECTELLGGAIHQKELTVETSIPKKLSVFADEVTIHTVFRNILSNAIKFSPKGGTIGITAEPTTDSVLIRISDNGVGMSEEVLHKIFKKQEPYSTKGTMDEAGSGLGLYLVRDFIHKNGGTVNVHSDVGAGTTVEVALPLTSV